VKNTDPHHVVSFIRQLLFSLLSDIFLKLFSTKWNFIHLELFSFH